MTAPIFSVVGKSNSGKTTLIERLILELRKRGYRVGTIKHDVHSCEIDHEGKDSWRMAQAGSEVVVISSLKKIAMIRDMTPEKRSEELSLDESSRWLFPKVDLIITEGYKTKDKPKIEVTQTGELLCGKESNLFAVVFNQVPVNEARSRELGAPGFSIEQVREIVDLIEEKIIRSKAPAAEKKD